jgi:Arc/MetJ family transcription regulator
MVGRTLDDVRALVSAGVAMNTLTTIKSTVAAMVRRELLDLARIKEDRVANPAAPVPY